MLRPAACARVDEDGKDSRGVSLRGHIERSDVFATKQLEVDATVVTRHHIIQDCFHRLRIPPWLSEFFCLRGGPVSRRWRRKHAGGAQHTAQPLQGPCSMHCSDDRNFRAELVRTSIADRSLDRDTTWVCLWPLAFFASTLTSWVSSAADQIGDSSCCVA